MIDTSLIELEIESEIQNIRTNFEHLSHREKQKNIDINLIPMLLNINKLVKEVRLLSMSLENNNNTKD
jgi:hypothetical protein